jgi:SAM-dependent methyltransferase
VTPSHDRGDAAFAASQTRHFEAADAAHFEWQTTGPGFAPLEASLLAEVAAVAAPPYLEIGCGEGGNFFHVGGSGLRVGVVAFVAGDAGALPLASASMRTVLVRDVLHHLPHPGRAVAEAVRVLTPGGTLVVVEPNGANPLVALHARVVAAERGLRDSRPATVRALLERPDLGEVRAIMAQAFPLRRLVLHYRFGVPSLGRSAVAVRGIAAIERAAAAVVPRARWSYLLFFCSKAGHG